MSFKKLFNSNLGMFRSIRRHQADVSVLLFLAAGVAGIFSQAIHPGDGGAEMMRLADNIVRHGNFANPFSSLATGPSAANPPLYPFVVAGLMKVLPGRLALYVATIVGTILANAITAALLPRVSAVLFGEVIPGAIASVLWIAAMPALPGWDTSYTVAGLLFFCTFTSSSIKVDGRDSTLAALGGAVGGLLFLLNPSSLLISVPWIGFLFWRARSDLRSTAKYCSIFLAILGAFYVGWCGRNYYQLGAFVPRTNLGMTLYASNNGCAESSMFRDEMSGCYQSHHPNTSVQEAELLLTLGEVKYDRKRIADTKEWVAGNPGKFVSLTVTRMLQFWFPATEMIPGPSRLVHEYVVPDWVRNWVRQQNDIAYLIWVITCLSIPGLVLMVRNREPFVMYLLAVLGLYPLMYYVVVSDMRYRYPVLWLSLLAAGYFIRWLLEDKTREAAPTSASTERVICIPTRLK